MSYYIITSEGYFNFDINKNNKLKFKISNFANTIEKLYDVGYTSQNKDYTDKQLINYINKYIFKIIENKHGLFLKIELSDPFYGFPEYIIFNSNTNKIV